MPLTEEELNERLQDLEGEGWELKRQLMDVLQVVFEPYDPGTVIWVLGCTSRIIIDMAHAGGRTPSDVQAIFDRGAMAGDLLAEGCDES